MTESKPLWTVSGAPDFDPRVDALLKIAGIQSTAAIRSALVSHLQLAWGNFQYERKHQRQPSSKLLTQLKNSIRKTQALLTKLEKFEVWGDINFDHTAVDNLTISIAEFPGQVELPR